jgi:hypothetical protein
LKERFRGYCSKNNITLSDAVRDALNTYPFYKTFIEAIVENIQDPKFFRKFKSFYEFLPLDIKKLFDNLVGPEEDKLINETPPQLLKNLKVITKSHREILEKLL